MKQSNGTIRNIDELKEYIRTYCYAVLKNYDEDDEEVYDVFEAFLNMLLHKLVDNNHINIDYITSTDGLFADLSDDFKYTSEEEKEFIEFSEDLYYELENKYIKLITKKK